MPSRRCESRNVVTKAAAPRNDDAPALARSLTQLSGHRRDRLLEAVEAAAKELLRLSELAVLLPKASERIRLYDRCRPVAPLLQQNRQAATPQRHLCTLHFSE